MISFYYHIFLSNTNTESLSVNTDCVKCQSLGALHPPHPVHHHVLVHPVLEDSCHEPTSTSTSQTASDDEWIQSLEDVLDQERFSSRSQSLLDIPVLRQTLSNTFNILILNMSPALLCQGVV